MSLSGAHRAAFRREATQEGQVFAIRDPEGFPAPAGDDGRRAVPFWSKPTRAQLIVKHVTAYGGFEVVPIPVEEWLSTWMTRLEHDNLPMVRSTMQPLFRDVTDHVRTVQERIDSLREVLAFAFEASLLVGQAQETAVSKKLASWLAIIAVPTAIAGIYGMNFKHMPELEWQYGYFTVIGTILLVCSGLFWRFRRVGWL